MKLPVILAMLKKDFFGLLPLILLSLAIFLLVPVIANLDLVGMGGDQSFWVFLQANIYWLGFGLGLLLMISVIQQDPASSLTHDWLTRPVSRREWLMAKLVFLLLFFLLPVLLSRLIINLSEGMRPGLAFAYALGIESMEATLLLPLFLMAALLASNLRQLIMLMVGVFFVFLLPGWSATRPILAAAGIELGGDYDGLMWVQAVVVFTAGLIGAGFIFWLLYHRRQSRSAHVAFWSSVAVMFLAVYTPPWLYNWDRAIALNAALVNADNVELEAQISLSKAMACFPAAIVGNPNATDQELRVLEQAAWVPEAAAALEPGAMTFVTAIRYRETLTEWFSPAGSDREYSVPWRLDWMRSRARFAAETLSSDVELQYSGTALNRYQPLSATERKFWTLPANVLEQLKADPNPELVMHFDVALLKPTAFELPVDGRRHDFPGLGSCKAEIDANSNRVDIECLKRGVQPDLVSAQFVGMNSTRTDSSYRANYTHDWVQMFGRHRYEFALEMPSLLENPVVMISAYELQRLVEKQLVVPGILGDRQAVCPLPEEGGGEIERASSWSDKSPHEVSYISVEPGVRLEVLDWRQQDRPDTPTLLLLPGLGATAHSYDEIAPELAQEYNVVALTRRGTGSSSKPDRGYGIERLAQDVLRTMDAMEIREAVLVGHSFGGEELSYLGANHPSRVTGLIYLDAAYDRVSVSGDGYMRRQRALGSLLPLEPLIRPSELVSYEALQDYARRTGRNANIPEGEVIASYDLGSGEIKHDMRYLDALMRGIVAPDYASISVPALSLYAMAGSAADLMEGWFDQNDPELLAVLEELVDIEQQRKSAEIQNFSQEMSDARVVVLEGADHWIFLSHEQDVLRLMREFVEGL